MNRTYCSDSYTTVNPLPRREFSTAQAVAWRNGIYDIYGRIRAAGVRPYEAVCNGVRLDVLPDVYPPHFFTDSAWYSGRLPQIVGSGSLLEIGTGTGVVAIACARNGARVIATDMNPKAVENARLNVRRHGVQVAVRSGDVYDALNEGERFDFVFWAHPFNSWSPPVPPDMLLRSGIDPAYQALQAYISDARRHLNQNGRLLLGTGDSADVRSIVKIAQENAYTVETLDQAEMQIETGSDAHITYAICEFIPLR